MSNSESAYRSQWSISDSLPMYLAEFVGTMMYVLTMATVTRESPTYNNENNNNSNNTYSTNNNNNKHCNPKHQQISLAPLSVGFILVAMVYAFGHISGAHFNPAVTLSVYIRGFISLYDALVFVVIQVVGGLAGALLAALLTDGWPCIEPGQGVGVGRAFMAELIYSFALCIVVINVATTETQRGNFFYGVAIGLTVSVGATAVWNISGGSFNPAVGTALSITNAIRKGGTIKYIWLYWAAPLLGGVLGGLSFYVVNTKELESDTY